MIDKEELDLLAEAAGLIGSFTTGLDIKNNANTSHSITKHNFDPKSLIKNALDYRADEAFKVYPNDDITIEKRTISLPSPRQRVSEQPIIVQPQSDPNQMEFDFMELGAKDIKNFADYASYVDKKIDNIFNKIFDVNEKLDKILRKIDNEPKKTV